MNKTELLAKEYLCHKYKYKPDEIIKNNKTPDFICPDGKRFEVKLLYRNTILFYPNQILQMKEEDCVLVFDRDKFVSFFLWKERDKSYIKIKTIGGNLSLIRISVDTKNQLNKLKLTHSETYEEILQRLLKEKSEWI